MTAAAQYLFNRAFTAATTVDVEFDTAWKNGTDYLNHAATDPGAVPDVYGTMARCTDDHGRKVILIKTRLGNVVVFQRYSGDYDTYVYNMPHALSTLLGMSSGRLTDDQMGVLVGDVGFSNIGHRLEDLFTDAAALAKRELAEPMEHAHMVG